MKKTILFLLILVTGVISCGKKSAPSLAQETSVSSPETAKPVVVSSPGSFSGTISPAIAVKSINFVLSGSGQSYSCSPDTITGKFKMANLPEGVYRITFSNDGRYKPLAYQNAPVFSGKNNDLGTFSATAQNYYVSYAINGTYEGWFFKAYYSTPYFNVGPSMIGSYPEDMRTAYYLSITLDRLTGPGTYTFKGGTSKSKITYAGYRLGNGIRISYQSTEYAGAEGTVIISSIDSNKRVVQGTFTATLTSSSGNAADIKVIRNGLINAPY
jgi:hypothetical protein